MEVVLVTAGYDHSIKYWNVLEGTCIHSIQHNESHINRLAISNDKRYLAVAGNPCIRLYDNSTAFATTTSSNNNTTGSKTDLSPVALLEGHRSNVTAVGWSYEGKWVWSASEDGTARVWDVRTVTTTTTDTLPQPLTIKSQREFASKYPICDAALHPDQSELATVDERGVLRVWALVGKECLFESVPEADAPLPVALQSVAYSPDGASLACCNATGMVYIYSRIDTIDNGIDGDDQSPALHTYRLAASFKAHSHYITRISFTPDGQSLCTCSADGTCRLFSVPTTPTPTTPTATTTDYIHERTFTGHQRWVWDCAFSADSAYLMTAASDNTARLFERRTGDIVSVFTGHSKAITCIALNDIP